MALPSGYKRLEYITITDSRYFDTGRVPTANTKIVMGFQLAEPGTGNRCLFGVAGQFSFRWYGTNGCFRSNGANNVDFPTGISGTAYHTVEKTATSCTLDGSDTVSTTVGSPTLSLYVMAQHTATGVSNYASGDIYGFQWYEGDELVADYVPCMSESGMVGLWDNVSQTFLGAIKYIAPAGDHNTNISDVAYALESGTALYGGAAYEIESGMTLMDGVAWEIPFSGGLHTVTLGASTLSTRAYAEVDGVKYTTAVTLQVKSGTTLAIFAKKTSTRNTYVYLNGEKVLTAGGTTFFSEYSMAIESDVTVEYSGDSVYYVYITTS